MSVVYLSIACMIGVLIGLIVGAIMSSAKTSDLELEVEGLEMQLAQALRVVRSHDKLAPVHQETRDLIEDLKNSLRLDSTNG